jgi:hypothetical protein
MMKSGDVMGTEPRPPPVLIAGSGGVDCAFAAGTLSKPMKTIAVRTKRVFLLNMFLFSFD